MYTEISNQKTVGKGEEQRLREQIELLESRLRAMGLDGDCAYERAMSSLYPRLLEELRTRLARLQPTGPAATKWRAAALRA